MDFAWTPEQLEYKNAAIRFAQKELSQGVTVREQQEIFPRDLWQKCADFGVLGLPFAEENGGAAADILTTMLPRGELCSSHVHPTFMPCSVVILFHSRTVDLEQVDQKSVHL